MGLLLEAAVGWGWLEPVWIAAVWVCTAGVYAWVMTTVGSGVVTVVGMTWVEVEGVAQGVSVLVLVMLGITTVEVSTEGAAVLADWPEGTVTVADWTSAVEMPVAD